ncbi:autoinducer synthase [Sphingomonas donggukensis]|uniref:Acyl-homoserine-lactone synthase n=1 Tax=Sphingomonas donggukensis TaxID=2949093 RepID=A0ABY4TYY2_9SPHN|nr:acyl-homoserine-lactone synthase [Sphingomonas donggukensis]URW77095.1 autoinducer synthase [Sphingomonas donggukensis]
MLIVDDRNRAAERAVIRSMFEARKQVFVDLLRWDVPVLAGRFEVDQFDDGHATYLILTDTERRHLASTRLLPTERPGILNTLYPQLCDEPPPEGPDVFEITRFCLSRGQRAVDRRLARDRLVTGLVRFARDHGIRTYTGVAEIGWLQQILAFGWECRPLGLPLVIDGRMLGALQIDIDADSLTKLAAAGIHADVAPAIAA